MKPYFILVFLWVFLLPNTLLYAQEEAGVAISAGVGMPDGINVGLRYPIKNMQLGLSLGTFPTSDEQVFVITGDLFTHFAGASKYRARKPWYFRSGFSYIRDETEYEIQKTGVLATRIGRDLNFSRIGGMRFDVGALFILFDKEIEKSKPPGNPFFTFDIDFQYTVLPSLGLEFFIHTK